MAVIFLSLNGIGLGHISRAFTISGWLKERGVAPVIFAQGRYPEFMSAKIPGVSIPTIYKLKPVEREAVALDLTKYARMTAPSVVVEDTHPAPIELPDYVERVLLVRPTAISYMRHLNLHYRRSFKHFFVTDHPESPTWPFPPDETAEVSGWQGWSFAGPVYRAPDRRLADGVRERHRIGAGETLYVFTMGGGGAQRDPVGAAASFCAQACAVAEELRRERPGCRLLFVRGPLFPAEYRVPEMFEDIAVEPDMPNLLALAAGAVIRPGFNTTWECIGARVPFLPIRGETFMEPVLERTRRLAEFNLAPEDQRQWLDPAWGASFRRSCADVTERWSPKVTADALCERLSPETPRTRVLPRPPGVRARAADGPPLLVRIDDVIDIDRELAEALELCFSRGLKPSLEVIPYLSALNDELLSDLLHGHSGYEVSQHGYAHLPRRTKTGRKAEFTDEHFNEGQLREGSLFMRERFPRSFVGGYSAPFDSLPAQFAGAWLRMGGRYVSFCRDRRVEGALGSVRLTLDPWDWAGEEPVPESRLMAEARRSAAGRGYVGVVLHPFLFKRPGESDRIAALLDGLLDFGCRPSLLSECALGVGRKGRGIEGFLAEL